VKGSGAPALALATTSWSAIASEALSPILLVRDPSPGRVVVADGYHRLCSVYAMDHEAPIPCKIV